MYAIIAVGGKQQKAEVGKKIIVDRLDAKVDDVVEFPVLMTVDDDKVVTGTPKVKNVVVKAKVLEHLKDKKIVVFKYKAKKNERKKQGHRQALTKVLIESIG